MAEQKSEIVGMKKRCELLGITRSTLYYKPRKVNDIELINEIYEIYERWPFYGYRRIHVELRRRGIVINHKMVQRLMQVAGIRAIYSTPKTSIKNMGHLIHEYLLKDLDIVRPNQVWQVDITYIKIKHGFVYLICLIDVFSRRIVWWHLSTFLDAESCMQALQNALLDEHPEIINSDQGCQFTSATWTDFLTKNNIKISMDGKGRWVDNKYIERLWRTIKYESVFLNSFDTVAQARAALNKYINFYNELRPHQTLNYHTPNEIYNLKIIPSKQSLFDSFVANRKECVMIPKII